MGVKKTFSQLLQWIDNNNNNNNNNNKININFHHDESIISFSVSICQWQSTEVNVETENVLLAKNHWNSLCTLATV